MCQYQTSDLFQNIENMLRSKIIQDSGKKELRTW